MCTSPGSPASIEPSEAGTAVSLKGLEAGCLAHARRKFFDVFEATQSPLAKTTLEKIAALYRIEVAIRGRPNR